MKSNLYYLCTSLPPLGYSYEPNFDLASLYPLCKNLLSNSDFEVLKECELSGKAQSFYKVIQECQRIQKDSFQQSPLDIKREALNGYRYNEPEEAETALFLYYWRMIDELQKERKFTIEWLCLYSLKLQLSLIYHNTERIDQTQLNPKEILRED